MECNYCVREVEENMIDKSKCYYCSKNGFKAMNPIERSKEKAALKKYVLEDRYYE